MTISSDFLERKFLPFVEKPNRYVGLETGLPILPERPVLRVALGFPDLYDLGMSYLGLRILLHLATKIPGISCERVFMPWFDAAQRLRALNLPLFTLETKTPLNELDLIGFNLQYELHATNVLAMLDLGRIPLYAEERSESDPIVLGGGPHTAQPEAFAPFFDALAIGDGEEIFPEILTILKSEKQKGSLRQKRIRALGDLQGIYLPSYYIPQFTKGGKYRGIKCFDSNLPLAIKSRITPALLPKYYNPSPFLPMLETAHNRLVLEVARGCSRGCRFCAPGMTNRPVRERPVGDLVAEAEIGLATTGYSEVSLLSLSTADYRYLPELLDALAPVLKKHRAALSFPSLRPDLLTAQMADRASEETRTGLTFAPEAATPRLRSVINKETSNEALLNAVGLAFKKGWRLVKLYFMIGLPEETEEDVLATVELIKEVERIAVSYRGQKLNISISPFSPKPHTPFELEPQLESAEVRRRLSLLKMNLRGHRMVNIETRAPEIAMVETAIARSDRRGARAIERSYREGGMFDAWSDGFNYDRWKRAFEKADLNLPLLTGSIDKKYPLPWEHIDLGIDRDFLRSELEKAMKGEFTDDCRKDSCQLCGLQNQPELPCPDLPELPVIIPAIGEQAAIPDSFNRCRLVYRRLLASRFTAHLDAMEALKRSLRRLSVPLEFTKGFKPHLRITSSPPLMVGLLSDAEFLDFGIADPWNAELDRKLQDFLPSGFELVQVVNPVAAKPNIGALNFFLYRVIPHDLKKLRGIRERIQQILYSERLPVERVRPDKVIRLDARPGLWKLEAEDGSILIGLRTLTGPCARVTDIISLLMCPKWIRKPPADPEVIADWEITRIGMWWELNDVRTSPLENRRI